MPKDKTLQMPKIGLGTLGIQKGDAARVIQDAIRIGYRLFDCAPTYRNESEIGQAINDLIQTEEIQRDDLFLTSKIFNTHHIYDGNVEGDRPRESLKQSLRNLQVDHLDLLLMHWPHAFADRDPPKLRDRKGRPNPNLLVVEEYLDTWRSMQTLQSEGLVKHIGVCNFKIDQLQRILDAGFSKPAVNQVELHVYLQQSELVDYCQHNGIQLMAYAPLGPKASKRLCCKPSTIVERAIPMEDPAVRDIARGLNTTSAQVLLQWGVQRGFVCIPKSTDPAHQWINFQASLKKLDKCFMMELAALDGGQRTSFGFLKNQYDAT